MPWETTDWLVTIDCAQVLRVRSSALRLRSNGLESCDDPFRAEKGTELRVERSGVKEGTVCGQTFVQMLAQV